MWQGIYRIEARTLYFYALMNELFLLNGEQLKFYLILQPIVTGFALRSVFAGGHAEFFVKEF